MSTSTIIRFASPKQVNFIIKLSSERGLPIPTRDHLTNLSVRAASWEIDRLLNLPRPTPTAAITDAPAATREPLETGRVYVNESGQFVRVVESRMGRQYGKVFNGRSFQYEAGALTGSLRTPTAEEAAAHGHAHGNCVFCSRDLTDERSTTVGYGPVCAERYSLPWG